MAEAALHNPLLTADEYLAFELGTPLKHEFVDGLVYGMGGASDRHNLISTTLLATLFNHLPVRCQVFMADMKLRIRTDRTEVFYYPDILVSCAATDRATLYREQPVLLIEVLSESTERTDRNEKRDAYLQIPSLEEYVLVSQSAPRIEIYRRRTQWKHEILAAGETLRLDSVDLDLAVAAIYARAGF